MVRLQAAAILLPARRRLKEPWQFAGLWRFIAPPGHCTEDQGRGALVWGLMRASEAPVSVSVPDGRAEMQAYAAIFGLVVTPLENTPFIK